MPNLGVTDSDARDIAAYLLPHYEYARHGKGMCILSKIVIIIIVLLVLGFGGGLLFVYCLHSFGLNPFADGGLDPQTRIHTRSKAGAPPVKLCLLQNLQKEVL